MRNPPAPLVLRAMLAGMITILIAGCGKPQESTGTPPPRTSMGTEIDDSVITARVKSALLADADVKSLDFQVETRKGEVQLSGFVDNQAQLDRAIVVVRAVDGVKSIANNTRLKGAATTIGNEVDDGIVTGKVKAALLADASVRGSDIAVVTRRGEVQLSGYVDSQGQIDRALEVARGIEDVRSVSNEMSVKK